jgi:hypothetical protein
MANRQWFIANGDKKDGPYPDERLRELIASGAVTADTLVWSDGMTTWARAGDVPGLVPQSGGPSSPFPTVATARGHAGNAFFTKVRVWPLFGRALLVVIGQMLVVPSPWTTTSFFRWFVDHIEHPQGKRVTFAGKPGDIWYVFVLNALCSYVGLISNYIPLLILPVTTFLSLLVLRWFFANLVREGSSTPLEFTGDYLAVLGWTVLGILSVITIIGWAWVTTAAMRWICRNIEGSSKPVIFRASGWSYLWRTLLFALSAGFLVPIPWTLRWYVRWIVSQFALSDEQTA